MNPSEKFEMTLVSEKMADLQVSKVIEGEHIAVISRDPVALHSIGAHSASISII